MSGGISIVIPHLNEPRSLARSLQAVAAQAADGTDVEVIVVDNGSAVLPEEICAAYTGVRLAQEPTPGPGPARNRGARLATRDIIAFLDADCTPQPGWLRRIDGVFRENPDIDIIGGGIDIAFADLRRPTALEAYESVFSYRTRLFVERHHYAATGNMAVRRHVFFIVGDFAGIMFNEDVLWGQRAYARGFNIVHVPEARVATAACRTYAALCARLDRHVIHEYEEMRDSGGKPAWLLRSLLMAASPMIDIGCIAMSRRLPNLRARVLAAWCLMRIRLRRARLMMRLVMSDRPNTLAKTWNRKFQS